MKKQLPVIAMLIALLTMGCGNNPMIPGINRSTNSAEDGVINAVQMANQFDAVEFQVTEKIVYNGYIIAHVTIYITNPTDYPGYNLCLIYMGSGFIPTPDSHTTLWNPIDYPVPGLFGYTHGDLATPGYVPTTQDNELISYGYIAPQTELSRNMVIHVPIGVPLKIAYAISVDIDG